jgi:hypothetical protein
MLRTAVAVGPPGFRFVRRVAAFFRPRAVAIGAGVGVRVVSRAFVIARFGMPLEVLTHREVPHPRRAEAVRRTGVLRVFTLRTVPLRAMRLRTVTLRTMQRAMVHRVLRAVLRTMFRSGVTRMLAVRAVFAGIVIALRRASAIFATALGVLSTLGAIVLTMTVGRLRHVTTRTVPTIAGAHMRRLARAVGLGVVMMIGARLRVRTGLVIGTMFRIGTRFMVGAASIGAATFRAARLWSAIAVRLALAVGTRTTCVRSGAATGKGVGSATGERSRPAAGHQLAHRAGLIAEDLLHLFVNLAGPLRIHISFASRVAGTFHKFAYLASLIGAERLFHALFKFFATGFHRLRIEAGATFGARLKATFRPRLGLAHLFAARLFFAGFFAAYVRLARLVLFPGSILIAQGDDGRFLLRFILFDVVGLQAVGVRHGDARTQHV